MTSRIKIASIATTVAALLLSLALLTPSRAQAAEMSNGFGMNGFGMNGWAMNGWAMNGWAMNGWAMNGWAMNGLSPTSRPVTPAAIWAAHGIDLRQPLAAAVQRVGR